MRRLPLAIVSSVLTVTSLGCASSTLCLPERHVGEREVPSSSVSAVMSRSLMVTLTRGIGRFLKRSSTTPSKLICGPAATISVDDGEVVAVGDLHRRRLAVDLGRLEHELLGGGDGGGVEVGAAPLTTSTSPTWPSSPISIDSSTDAVMPASCLSWG